MKGALHLEEVVLGVVLDEVGVDAALAVGEAVPGEKTSLNM